MNKKTILSALVCAMMLPTAMSCSNEESSNNNQETIDATKDLQFTLSFSDYNEETTTEGTRATDVNLSKKEIIPMGDLFAEASVQRDTAKATPAEQAAATRAISDGTYTIYAYQGATLKGTLTGTVVSNVFTATSANPEIGLAPGTYTFVCANDKVNTSGSTWTVNRSDIETARIGIANNVVLPPTPRKQKVAFNMKHVGCKVRVRLTLEGYLSNNIQATLASTTNIPQVATFDPSTRTFTYGSTAAFTQNLSMPNTISESNSGNLFFFPGTQGADLQLTLNSGTAYKLPVTGRKVKFPSLVSMAMNGAYVLNLTLKYNYIYLYSDGTIGQYTDAAHATKIPIAMVVSQSKRLAVALYDAASSFDTGIYSNISWSSQQIQSNTTMSSTLSNHLNDFNGEDYTYSTTYSTDGIVKGNDQTNYFPFYKAAHYNPGVTITGANIGKWFLPTMGEWNLYYKNLKLADNDLTMTSSYWYSPDDYGMRRGGGTKLPNSSSTGQNAHNLLISASESSTNEYFTFDSGMRPVGPFYSAPWICVQVIKKDGSQQIGSDVVSYYVRPFIHY